MGDKCTPAAPNQLLTGIQALLMQSSCLFRLDPADNAAYTPRYMDAQPCRPAPCMLQKAKFAQVWPQVYYLAARISHFCQIHSTGILASSVLHLVIISPCGARHNIIDTRSRARGFCRLAGVLFIDSVGACQERGQAR